MLITLLIGCYAMRDGSIGVSGAAVRDGFVSLGFVRNILCKTRVAETPRYSEAARRSPVYLHRTCLEGW
jgi:hypothetical protein